MKNRMLFYISKYKGYVVATLLCAICVVTFSLYIPILVGRAIDYMIGPNEVVFELITQLLIQIVLLAVATSVFQWIMNQLNNKMAYGIVYDIRKEAFAKIQTLPLKYIDSKTTGDIVSRMVADVEQLMEGLLLGFTQLFTGVLTIIGTLLFMIFINFKLTIVVFVLTPISLFTASYIAKKTYQLFMKQSTVRGEQTSYIEEIIGNEKVVKAFGYEKQVIEKLYEKNERLAKISIDALFYASITNPATRFVNGIVYAIVALVGALFVLQGNLTIGGLSSFLSYSKQYTKPFNEISGVVAELQNALACARRVFELLDETSIDDVDGYDIRENAAIGEVCIDKISFSYEKNQRLIEDFSLHVNRGKKIAIVGPTGCGKTTIINLLMRFYNVTKGDILIENTSIYDMSLESLRKSYGMVLQDTWLKEGSIRENLKYGNEQATEEEMIAAAKEAYVDGFIEQLPNGYDTVIKSDGGVLSTGQKQLLCIARIILANPSMLILDEATSSIDTRTEEKIQQAFSKIMKDKTSFIVAHRLSTI
ncbi:MAG: ABC transporter ATP-binding protein, partial [Lachnospiraceae bacterium]